MKNSNASKKTENSAVPPKDFDSEKSANSEGNSVVVAGSLKSERKLGRQCLKDVRSEVELHAGRLSKETLDKLTEATDNLEKALRQQIPKDIALARENLESLAETHLNFQRQGSAREYFAAILEALLIALVIRFFLVEPYKIPSGSMIPTLLIGDHIFVNKLSYGIRLPLVGSLVTHWGGYHRGDVVVFVNPLDDDLPALRQRDYVKRIIGLPGDTIEVIGETIHVNGVPQRRTDVNNQFTYYDRISDGGQWVSRSAELLNETLSTSDDLSDSGAKMTHAVLRHPNFPHAWREGPFIVPPGHLFMMGDNRDNSQDGRYGRAGGWFVPFDHVKGRAFLIWFSWGVPGFGPGDQGLRFERLFQGL